MNPKLTIIIPARKEEEAILSTVAGVKNVKTPHKILVINDYRDPSDKTADITKAIKYTPKNPENGFAEVLAHGVRLTRTPYVVFVMADGCDDPATIDRMYETIITGYDVVGGSRYTTGGKKIGGPWLQGMFSKIINAILAKKIPTTDASNSFKMYRRDLLVAILEPVRGSVEYSIELIARAHAKGARITEVPTTWYGRTKGNSKFRMFARLPKYFFAILRALT